MSLPSILALLLATLATAGAQTPSQPPDPLLSLSPQAAYDQALLPISIVHRSVANWSDAEAASLAVAVAHAQTFCRARPAATLTGPTAVTDLLGLARLCALGQQWPAVLDAADRFLAAQPTPSPLPGNAPPPAPATPRAQALALKIEAALNLQDHATALATARTLLTSEPYTALSQSTTDAVIRYLQLIDTAHALDLAGQRLDHILALLRLADQPLTPDTLSAHELYTAALAAPTLLQLENNGPAAGQVVVSIESAVPPHLPTDELTLIALARRQYDLLGSVLPTIPASVSLFGSNETPRINRSFGTATVLLVFPDWCAQCVRMGAEFMPFLTRHAGEDVHLYGLLAQLQPPPVAAPPPARATRNRPAPPPEPPPPPTSADHLRGTPTLVVAADLPLLTFAATDFPLLVVTDSTGRIRFAEVAPDNAFIPGSLADQLVTRIADTWPAAPKP